jgi:hypothetical protein
MNTEQRKAIASKFFDDSHELMSILYSRWQDEKEYEDIADYGKVISEKVDAIGGTFVKMKKRPFGFTYKLADAEYLIAMSGSAYQYKRIA